jgi:thiol-disulfide isomerase/thioredoxin
MFCQSLFKRLRQVALLLFVGLALPLGAQATPGEVPVGGVLREATLHGLNGPDRRLSDFRGRPLIINVWASWCPPCIREMGSLESLAWSDAGQQFMVIGISTDDYLQAAQGLLRKTKATLNHFIDDRLNLENMLGADHLPLTVLVDANGRVLDKVVGAREWDSPASIQRIQQLFRLKSAATSLGKP